MTDQIKKEFEEALNAYGYACFSGGEDDADDASAYHARVLALFEAQAKPEGWIAVTERLPELNQECLVCWRGWGGEVPVAALRPTGPGGIPMWYGHGGSHNSVTHWMPLPAPPTQTDEK
jgi:hypothetical protein